MRYYGMSSQKGKKTETVSESLDKPIKTNAESFSNNFSNKSVKTNAVPQNQSEAARGEMTEAEDAATLNAQRAAAQREAENFRNFQNNENNLNNENYGSGENVENNGNGENDEGSLSRWLENQPEAVFPPHSGEINFGGVQNMNRNTSSQNARENGNGFGGFGGFSGEEVGGGVGIGNSGEGTVREEGYPRGESSYSDSREKDGYMRDSYMRGDYINESQISRNELSGGRINESRINGSQTNKNRGYAGLEFGDAISICPTRDRNDEYLCRAAGRFVKVELCCGHPITEKSGTLKYVGNDYIVIEESGSRNMIMCAMKNINTVTVYS